jgi:hypothetical protein
MKDAIKNNFRQHYFNIFFFYNYCYLANTLHHILNPSPIYHLDSFQGLLQSLWYQPHNHRSPYN